MALNLNDEIHGRRKGLEDAIARYHELRDLDVLCRPRAAQPRGGAKARRVSLEDQLT
jgi:hypothetical protein